MERSERVARIKDFLSLYIDKAVDNSNDMGIVVEALSQLTVDYARNQVMTRVSEIIEDAKETTIPSETVLRHLNSANWLEDDLEQPENKAEASDQ